MQSHSLYKCWQGASAKELRRGSPIINDTHEPNGDTDRDAALVAQCLLQEAHPRFPTYHHCLSSPSSLTLLSLLQCSVVAMTINIVVVTMVAITVAVMYSHVGVFAVGTACNRVAVERDRYSCVTAVENRIQMRVKVQQRGELVIHVRNENTFSITLPALGHLFTAILLYYLYIEKNKSELSTSRLGRSRTHRPDQGPDAPEIPEVGRRLTSIRPSSYTGGTRGFTVGDRIKVEPLLSAGPISRGQGGLQGVEGAEVRRQCAGQGA